MIAAAFKPLLGMIVLGGVQAPLSMAWSGACRDPLPSMLYTIEKYNGLLRGDDEILIDISNFIKQGSDNVREFVDKIKYGGPFKDNELIALMCKMQ